MAELELTEETAVALNEGLGFIGRALDRLGTGNAGTQMGAIEYLGKEVREASERIAGAIESLAQAIRESGSD